MLFKKIAVLLVAVALMAVSFSGCSSKTESTTVPAKAAATQAQKDSGVNKAGFPIVKDKITLKGFSRKDPQHGEYSDMWLWKEYEKKSNIHVEWDTPTIDNVTERLNLLLASNDLPDFIIKNSDAKGTNTLDRLINYGSRGTFIVLDKLVDEYAPNFKKVITADPGIKADITAPDGHIYSMPSIYDYLPTQVIRYPLINQKWMDALKLKTPTNSDELIDVLIAFRDKDPNGNGQKDEIPYNAHTIDMAFIPIGGMFGLDNVFGLNYLMANLEDNKINIWWDDPRYKDTVKYFKKLYDEKLVDQEIFQQTDKIYFGKLADGKVGYTSLYQPKNAGKYSSDYQAIETLKGPKGDQLWPGYNPKVAAIDGFIVTKANKYPEATVAWVDYFFGTEGATMVYAGPSGVVSDPTPDGGFKYKPEKLNIATGFELEMGKHTYYPGSNAVGYFTEKQLRPTMDGSPMPTYIDKVKNNIAKKRVATPLMDPTISAKVTGLRKDVDTYAKDMRAKFILGNENIDTKWDEYIKQLEKIGIKDLEKSYTDALNNKGK